MIHAYGTQRCIKRKSTRGNVRHAVDEMSHLCGAYDTVCGKPVVVRLGEWEPGNSENCQKCTAGMSKHPEELTA